MAWAKVRGSSLDKAVVQSDSSHARHAVDAMLRARVRQAPGVPCTSDSCNARNRGERGEAAELQGSCTGGVPAATQKSHTPC